MSRDLRQFREGSSKSATSKRLYYRAKPTGSTLIERVLKFSPRLLKGGSVNNSFYARTPKGTVARTAHRPCVRGAREV